MNRIINHPNNAAAVQRLDRTLLGGVFAAVLILGLFVGFAEGADREPRKRPEADTTRVQAVGQIAFRYLERAQTALAESDFAKANEALDTMEGRKLNEHERAIMHQTRGYLHVANEDYVKAAESFELCLAENAMSPSAQLSMRSNLGQIYVMLGEYDQAIVMLEQWLAEAEAPTAAGYYMLALAHAQTEDYDSALPHAVRAVDLSESPRESRLQLLSAVYFHHEMYDELLPVLDELVTHFPKKSYWMQLSAIHIERGNQREALATQEIVFEQGLMDQHREFMTLARLHINEGVPYEAAIVLEAGLTAESVDSDKEEFWSLLASAYIQSREFEKAFTPLEQAAKLAKNGKGFVRLGEVYLRKERFVDAQRAFSNALSRGGLDDKGHAYLMLGIALAGNSDYEKAKTAFNDARLFEKTAESARQWITHLDDQIRLASTPSELGEAHDSTGASSSLASDSAKNAG